MGLTFQLAIGPVFLFILNLTLQKSFLDGIAGVLAVTIVDYLYICLAMFGVGKLLDNKSVRKTVGILSALVLILFGALFIYGASTTTSSSPTLADTTNLFSSFVSVFLLTITNPLTIIFFAGVFSVRVVESNYSKYDLRVFGLSVGLATLLFNGIAVILFSFLRGALPLPLIQSLNFLVGSLLIGYGLVRIKATVVRGRHLVTSGMTK